MKSDRLLERLEFEGYIGKERIIPYLKSGELRGVEYEEKRCREVSLRHARFLDRRQWQTGHQLYLRGLFTQLLIAMVDYRDDVCEVTRFATNSYIYFSVFVHRPTRGIFGVVMGYVINKTPEEVWYQVWGRPPPLSAPPR